MKHRFILFRCRNTFYCEDTTTGRQISLRTRSEAEAKTLIHVRNESARQPTLNLQIARTYLAASDSGISNRTWQHALDALIATKKGSTQERWLRASRDPALRPLLGRTIISGPKSADWCVAPVDGFPVRTPLRTGSSIQRTNGRIPFRAAGGAPSQPAIPLTVASHWFSR